MNPPTPSVGNWPKYQRLWRYLRPFWKLELLSFLILAVLALLQLALPVALRYMVDDLIPGLDLSGDLWLYLTPILFFGGVLVGAYILHLALAVARDYLAAYIGGGIIVDIRAQLFDHLQKLSLRFHQQKQVGEIMSRMMSDVSRLQELLTSVLLSFLTNCFFLLAILVYLLITNWYLTLITLALVPVTIWLTYIYGKKMNVVAEALQRTIARLSAKLQETLVGLKVIKSFGQERNELQKTHSVLSSLWRTYINYSVTSSLSGNLVYVVSMVGPITVLCIGIYLVASGSMTLGALIAFFWLAFYLFMPIQALSKARVQIQASMASVDRVFEYLDEPVAVSEPEHPVTPATIAGSLQFNAVSFAYESQIPAVREINITINAGEKVAIVGHSGSGKSTIINLILRLYDPDQGEVTLDGVDLRKLSIATLRDNISVVDQDPLLFHASVGENIAYGKPDALRDEIEAAARVANIHDFIAALPNGYDTIVGERGVTLSGGEKQRICLARAVIKDPRVLLLDEATSALDTISERLIQQSLDKILQGKTAVIVAHRLSTVKKADRIITMERGRIIDQGSHTDLLARSQLYRDLAEHQLA